MVSELLNNKFAAAEEAGFKDNITLWIYHQRPFVAVRQQLHVNVAQRVGLTLVCRQLLAPLMFTAWGIVEVSEQIVIRQHETLWASQEYYIDHTTDVFDRPFIFAFLVRVDCRG